LLFKKSNNSVSSQLNASRHPASAVEISATGAANPADTRLLRFITNKKGKLSKVDRGQAWKDFLRLFGVDSHGNISFDELKKQCRVGLAVACTMASNSYARDLDRLKSNIAFISTDISEERHKKRVGKIDNIDRQYRK